MLASAASYFSNERDAHRKLEQMVWPAGPICPFCGARDRIGVVNGRGARTALKFCCQCRKQFRATLVTVFRGSHVPLHKWFQACFLRYCCEYPISAYRLHLCLGVTYKTTLCMVHHLDRATLTEGAEEVRSALCVGEPARPLCAPRRFRPSPFTRYDWQPVVGEIFDEQEVPWAIPSPKDSNKGQYQLFVGYASTLGGAKDDRRFEELLRNLVQSR
jgi:hypothetical protein